MKKAFILASLLVLGVISGCEKKDEIKKGQLTKVRFLLDWTPNTNHTGIYIAKERGYYKELGLDVEILPAGNDAAIEVISGEGAEFAIGEQEGITLAYSAHPDIDIVAVAALLQSNTSGFLVSEKSGIKSPKDMAGKQFGGNETSINKAILNHIIVKDGGEKDTVKYKNVNSMDVMQGLQYGIDFEWAYAGWDVIKAKLENKNMPFIKLTDYDRDLEFYTPVIMASNKYLNKNSDTAKKFLKATARGYEDAIKDPKSAAEILMKNAQGLDSALVENSQKFLGNHYKENAPYWGHMEPEVWEKLTKFLYENGGIKNEVDASKMFTNKYLNTENNDKK